MANPDSEGKHLSDAQAHELLSAAVKLGVEADNLSGKVFDMAKDKEMCNDCRADLAQVSACFGIMSMIAQKVAHKYQQKLNN